MIFSPLLLTITASFVVAQVDECNEARCQIYGGCLCPSEPEIGCLQINDMDLCNLSIRCIWGPSCDNRKCLECGTYDAEDLCIAHGNCSWSSISEKCMCTEDVAAEDPCKLMAFDSCDGSGTDDSECILNRKCRAAEDCIDQDCWNANDREACEEGGCIWSEICHCRLCNDDQCMVHETEESCSSDDECLWEPHGVGPSDAEAEAGACTCVEECDEVACNGILGPAFCISRGCYWHSGFVGDQQRGVCSCNGCVTEYCSGSRPWECMRPCEWDFWESECVCELSCSEDECNSRESIGECYDPTIVTSTTSPPNDDPKPNYCNWDYHRDRCTCEPQTQCKEEACNWWLNSDACKTGTHCNWSQSQHKCTCEDPCHSNDCLFLTDAFACADSGHNCEWWEAERLCLCSSPWNPACVESKCNELSNVDCLYAGSTSGCDLFANGTCSCLAGAAYRATCSSHFTEKECETEPLFVCTWDSLAPSPDDETQFEGRCMDWPADECREDVCALKLLHKQEKATCEGFEMNSTSCGWVSQKKHCVCLESSSILPGIHLISLVATSVAAVSFL